MECFAGFLFGMTGVRGTKLVRRSAENKNFELTHLGWLTKDSTNTGIIFNNMITSSIKGPDLKERTNVLNHVSIKPLSKRKRGR